MSDPLFSIVLPSYNRAAMLRSAIESVLWQTWTDYECFVLDNHSDDDTPRVFAEYAHLPKFHFQRFAENRGVPQSRNFAIRNARGRYITFLDSDDLWLPDRLAEFQRTIDRAPDAGFIFSNAYELRHGRIVGRLFAEGRAIPEGRVPGYYAVGESRLPYVTTNLAIVREAFDRVGLYRADVKLLDDTELYSRMLAAGYRVAVIPRPLAVRTLHASQITHAYRQAFSDALLSLRSGGADETTVRVYRDRLAADAALFLIKSGQPAQARQFLCENPVGGWLGLGVGALARLPAPLLRLGRVLRRAALELRHGPALQGREFRQVEELIAPLLGPHRA